eukprot:3305182-Rhodomonas_salina.7
MQALVVMVTCSHMVRDGDRRGKDLCEDEKGVCATSAWPLGMRCSRTCTPGRVQSPGNTKTSEILPMRHEGKGRRDGLGQRQTGGIGTVQRVLAVLRT